MCGIQTVRLSPLGRRLVLAGSTIVVALLALPGCGIVTKDFEGDVEFSFNIDDGDGDRCYGVQIRFDPDSNEDVRNERDGVALGSGARYRVVTTRRDGVTTRSICADEDAPPVVNQPVDYVYARYGRLVTGRLFITTARPLQVVATVVPDSIAPGQPAQLLATVSGGVTPFSYSWSPADTLTAADLADPIASPTATTAYTVTVTDSVGQSQTASVIVTVLAPVCRPEEASCSANDQCCSGFCSRSKCILG